MEKISSTVSLAVLAARCGVSRRVVAAVLSPHSGGTVGFSEATREKVEAAAREAGYQGNRTARWLARGRHGSIGIIARTSYLIPEAMMNGMQIAARKRGLFLILDRALKVDPPMFLEESCVDGLVSFDDLREEDCRRVKRMDLPILWVNTNRREGLHVMSYDEYGAAKMAAEHLAERGWQHPMTLDFAGGDHYSADDRQAGAHAAAPKVVRFLSRTKTGGVEGEVEKRVDEIEQFLRRHPEIDSALAFHSALVPPLYEALRRLAKHPGIDFGVVTFGRYGPSRSVFPLVTALALDEQALGERIVGSLEDRIEGRPVKELPITVAYELIVRGSTGPPVPREETDPTERNCDENR